MAHRPKCKSQYHRPKVNLNLKILEENTGNKKIKYWKNYHDLGVRD